MPSQYFPHVNLPALKKWAAVTAANHHPVRNVSRRGGKSLSKATPIITSCEDTIFAGTRMILITFDPASLPMGPRTMLAHFPRCRPRLTTLALVGMTEAVRALHVRVPKIYAVMDSYPNDIGAEAVLLEKVAGENLAEAWPNLSADHKLLVLKKIAEIVLALFSSRTTLMNTDLLRPDVDTRPNTKPFEKRITYQAPILLAPAFDQGPLQRMTPVHAFRTSGEYLKALADRVERIFSLTPTGDPTPENLLAHVQRIRDTWKRLAALIPYHTGGFYVPSSIPQKRGEAAISLLSLNQFAIKHADMQMCRFILETRPSERPDADPEFILTLTGWEYAHRAPLWSCASLPPFLTPQTGARNVMSPEERARYRDLFVRCLMNDDSPVTKSWQWFMAFMYGQTERWFESCLNMHWQMRDHVEFLLPSLKAHWMAMRPEIPFPLLVGKEYAAPGDTALRAADRPETKPNLDLMGISQSTDKLGSTLGEEWGVLSSKWLVASTDFELGQEQANRG